MRTPLAVAAVAAISLLAGAGTAQAAKPSPPAGSHSVAPDLAGQKATKFAASKGALGAYYDSARKQSVIVTGAGKRISDAAADAAVGANARVERRNISRTTVSAIQDTVAKRSFSPAAKNYNYASYLDLKTGKVVLKTDAPASVTEPLRQQFAGLIDQQHEVVRDTFDRRNDVPSFWGGSSISDGSSICSSAFVVQKPTGARYLATAGHCFSVGTNVYTTDGGRLLGSVVQRGPFLPWPFQSYDMELIGGQSYGSYIFVGGTTS